MFFTIMYGIFSVISVLIIIANSQDVTSPTMTSLPKIMRAVGLYKYLPISDVNSLIDLQVNLPTIQREDVLVEVKAISINPIDAKQRAPYPKVETEPRILGWDGAGIVVAKGEVSKIFNVGDEVFFTGEITRNGSNAQFVALNEIVVGAKPKTLTFEEAAALPLTSLTAYESLYDRLGITEKDEGKSLLIINSSGGVGSVASQLAKNLKLKVIGTASRKESQEFSLRHGVDVVLNHTQDLRPQLEAKGFGKGVDFILVNYDPFPYWDTMMQVIKPQGKICFLVDSSQLVNMNPIKDKSLTLAAEGMFTRMIYKTEDRHRQHEILQEISKMVDSGKLKTTLTTTLSPINAANLKEAHRLIEEKK